MTYRLDIEYDNSTEHINTLLEKVSNYIREAKAHPEVFYSVVFIFKDNSLPLLVRANKNVTTPINYASQRLTNFINGIVSVTDLINTYLQLNNLELYAIPFRDTGLILSTLNIVQGNYSPLRFNHAVGALTTSESYGKFVWSPSPTELPLNKGAYILGTLKNDTVQQLVIGQPNGEIFNSYVSSLTLAERPDLDITKYDQVAKSPIILQECYKK